MFLTSIQIKSYPEYQWYGALLMVEWLIIHVLKCFPHRCRHIGGINSINKHQLIGYKGNNRNSFLCIISWLWTLNITPIGNFLSHLVTKRLLQLWWWQRLRTFIVNTDMCDRGGSHWVEIHLPLVGSAEFVNQPQYYYCSSQIRPDDIDTFGLYCLYYSKRRYRGTRTKFEDLTVNIVYCHAL
jgi:hypothetical protein